MPKIITIMNQKGGVGKTSTTINLASALARYNKRVLLLDMDPQGNCSLALGIDPTISKKTMSELLLSSLSLKQVIRKSDVPLLSLVPSNLTLAMVESSLYKQDKDASVTLLKEKLEDKEIQNYDYVFIDCPPSLGFLSLNALVASQYLLIPMQCEYFALDGLTHLLSTIAKVQREDNPTLSIMGILLTMVDSKTNLCSEVSSEVRKNFKDAVFITEIPRNVSIPEAISKGMPVNLYKPLSAGSLAYASLAREVINRIEEKEKQA